MFTYDLGVYRGDSFSQTFIFKKGELPEDLTGWSWVAQTRTSEDATTAIPFTVDASAAAEGKITVSLAATVTATLPAGVWDLQGTKAGVVRTFVRGAVMLTKDVSRV